MPISKFTLEPGQISFVGSDLSRPECVLATLDGTLWTSDNRGGVTRIGADGTETTLGSIGGLPNGIALEHDQSILITEIESGSLYRLRPDQGIDHVVGRDRARPFGFANFVHLDSRSRIWLTMSTATVPRTDAVKKPIPDGRLLVVENGSARVVADGLCFLNEVRVDRAYRYLYAAETALGRIVRFPILASGDLGEREVFGPKTIFDGALVDGIAFDAEGTLWVTEVSRNGIYAISPDGDLHRIFEDRDGAILSFPSSLAFGGPDLCTVYVGSVHMKQLGVFRSPVPGEALVHWK